MFTWLAALAAGSLAFGQQGGAADVLQPKEPLVPNMGGRMEYKVRYFYSPGVDWETSPKWVSNRADKMQVDEIVYSLDQASGLARVDKKWGNGTVHTEWFLKGVCAAKRSNGVGYYIVGSGQAPRAGMGEFSWIKLSNYKGLMKFNGTPVFVFRERVEVQLEPEPADPEPSAAGGEVQPRTTTLNRVAYLDAKTQMPILLYEGEAIRVYVVSTAALGPLMAPVEVVNTLKAFNQEVEERVALPGNPAG